MERKKWTAKTTVTEEILKFREKRKWQLALRRYVLEKMASTAYAPYFGLDAERFRQWIEIQFSQDIGWKDFATAWQFDHVVPVTYFDFSNREEMRLCWNFTNIRVEKFDPNKNRGNRIDILAVKPYFQHLYDKTNYGLCLKMLQKIDQIEVSDILCTKEAEDFINHNKDQIEVMGSLNEEEFARVNLGITLKDILLEREMVKKFGAQ